MDTLIPLLLGALNLYSAIAATRRNEGAAWVIISAMIAGAMFVFTMQGALQ